MGTTKGDNVNHIEKKIRKNLAKLAHLFGNELDRKDHDSASLKALASEYEWLANELRELAKEIEK